MKDPLGAQTLQRAIARGDHFEGELHKAHFALRQIQTQNADLVRMLAAVTRRALALAQPDEGPAVEAVVLSFEDMANEGKVPKLAYRINRQEKTLTLRLTPFPDQVKAEEKAEDPPPEAEPEKPPRSRLIIVPGEEGA